MVRLRCPSSGLDRAPRLLPALMLLALCACRNRTITPVGSPAPDYTITAFDKMKGLTFVAPPRPFRSDPMQPIVALGSDCIAVIPYAFTRPGQPAVRYNIAQWQWWGERPEGVSASIALAHKAGLKVMLKPQVYVPGSWTGQLDFDTPEDWARWEADYTGYIVDMARIADSMRVDLFCIGTEFARSVARRPAFWTGLIRRVRAEYGGKLTYAANWDEWEATPFWEELDYVGVNAYFPLLPDPTPTVEALSAAWAPIALRLEALSKKTGRPILFTEYGYLSVDQCAWRTWELEADVQSHKINQAAQANALAALWNAFGGRSWWAGGFLWKWFPEMQGHEGYPERDYTPQGKDAEEALRRIFK